MPTLPDSTHISIGKTAEILGVSVDTVRRWDKEDKLHSIRPDGKNRYFSLEEIEKIKSSKPFSISDVSSQLHISQTTLRRLEEKGILQPQRNANGERTYDKKTIQDFLQSDYSFKHKELPSQTQIDDQIKVATEEILKDQKQLARLTTYFRFFYDSVALIVAFVVVVISVITVMLYMFPEEMGTLLGYQQPSSAIALEEGSKRVVLAAATSAAQMPSLQESVFSTMLRPFAAVSLQIVKATSSQTYQKVVPVQPVTNISDVFTLNQQGDLVPLRNIKLEGGTTLQIQNNSSIQTSNGQSVVQIVPANQQGSQSGNYATLNADGTITNLQIINGNLTNGSVATINLQNGSVTTEKIADGAITNSELAPNSVTTTNIVDRTITNQDIASGAINGTSIANGSVIRNINGITDGFTLAAGTGINISTSGATLTINNTGSLSQDTLQTVTNNGATTTNSVTLNGGLSDSAFTANGGILYTNGSGVVSQTAVGTNGQCLQSVGGGVPTWGSCGSGSSGVTSLNSATGVLTLAGGGINSVGVSGSTITITGTEADTLSSVVGRGSSAPAITLSNVSNQLVLGTTNTITINAAVPSASRIVTLPDFGGNDSLVGLAATQTLTNKTISGASNTITNIGNGSLTNPSLTITAGTGLTGGGSVSLGGSTTLNTVQDIATSASPTFTGLTVSGLTESKVLFTDSSSNLTTTGTVGVGQGGTGVATFGGTNTLLYSSSANTLSSLTAGTNGQILVGKTSAAPGFVTLSGDATVDNTGVFTLKNTGTASTYGSSSQVPVFTTDAQGRVTSVTNTTIAVGNSNLTNSSIIFAGDSGSGSTSLGGTQTIAGTSAQGITTSESGSTLTITATNASTSQKGVASFSSSNFSVASGVVSITAGGVGTNELAANGVTSAKIANNTIDFAQISDNPTLDATTTIAFGTGGSNLNFVLGTNTGNGNLQISPNAGGNAAEIINKQGPSGDIFTASQSGSTKFTVQGNGNLVATGTLTGLTGLTVNSGAVSLPSGSISNGALANSSVTITAGTGLTGGGSIALGGSVTLNAAQNITTNATPTFSTLTLSNTTNQLVLGTTNTTTVTSTAPSASRTYTIPDFGSNDTFAGIAATQTFTNKTISGSNNTITNIGNGSLTNSDITFVGDSGSGTTSLGGTQTVAGTAGQGITTSESGSTLTISANNATTSTKGVASFNSSNFSVSSGVVSLASQGVSGSNIANNTIDFAQISDNPTLDATTTIALGTGTQNFNFQIGTNATNGTVVVAPNAGGQSALIINKQGANGDLVTASASGTTKFVISNTGTVTAGGLSVNNVTVVNSSGQVPTTTLNGTLFVAGATSGTTTQNVAQGNTLTFTAGTDITTTGAAGSITFATNSTLASVTGRGATTSTALTLSSSSNNITVGTLTATGGTIDGVAIGGTTRSTAKFTTLDANSTVNFGGLGGGSATTSLCLDGSNNVKPCTSGGSTATLQSAFTNGSSISFGDTNLTLGDTTGNGNVLIAPRAGGQAALIINKQGGNDIFTASASGNTKLQLTNAGALNLVGGQTSDIDTLTATTLKIGASTTNGITIGNGTAATTIIGSTGTSTVTIKDAATGGSLTLGSDGSGQTHINFGGSGSIDGQAGQLQIKGKTNIPVAFYTTALQRMVIDGAGFVGIGNTLEGNGALVVNQQNLSGTGDIFSASTSGSTKFTIQNNGNVVATGTLTGLTGLTITSGGETVTAGDVAITAGNLTFNGTTRITNAGVGTFTTGTVIGSQTFTTNNIADSGSLTIASGSNNNITLTPNGSGNTVLSSDFNTGIYVGSSTNTPAVLSVSGGIANNAALIINNINNGDLIDASASGTTKFQVSNGGNVTAGTYNGNSITTGTGTLTLGAGKTLTANDSTTLGTNVITLAGGEVLTFTPSNALTLTTTGSTSVTLPTSGTLVNSGVTTLSSLTTVGSLVSGTVIGTDTFTNNNIADSGNLTIASGGSGVLTLHSASSHVTVKTGDFLTLSVAGVSGAGAGDIWYDSSAQKFKINENGTTKTLCNTTDLGCGSGVTSTSPFQELSGAIVPNNATEDFLIGGQSTGSAKFAITNINSGTPTASAAGNLIVWPYTSGTSQLGGILGIGSGGIVSDDSNGAGGANGIARLTVTETNPNKIVKLVLNGPSSGGGGAVEFMANGVSKADVGYTQNSNELQIINRTNNPTTFFTNGTGTNNANRRLSILGSGEVVIGPQNTANVATTALDIEKDANGDSVLVINQKSAVSTDIFTASNSGTTKFTVSTNGNITATGALTGLTGETIASGGETITAGDLAITGGNLNFNGTQRISNAGVGTFITGTVIGSQTFTTNNIADSGALTIATGSNNNLTLTSNGSGNTILSSDFNTGVYVGSSTNTPAVLSVSGGIANNGALIINNINNGDLIDASQSGTTKFQVSTAGNVTAGTYNGNTITAGTGTLTLGASKTLTANDTTTLGTNAITLAGGEVITFTASNALTFTTTGSTNVTLPTSGTLINSGVTTLSSLTTVGSLVSGTVVGSDTFTTNNIGDSGSLTVASGGSGALTLHSATNHVIVKTGDFLTLGVSGVTGAGAGDIWYDTSAQKFKINENGTTKTLCNITDAGCGTGGAVTLQSAFNNGTTISFGNTNLVLGDTTGNGNVVIAPRAGGQAALIVNDQGSGDIFTASSSGNTKFTIQGNGNLVATGTLTGLTGETIASGGLTVTSGDAAITAGALTFNGTTRISNAGVGTFITGTTIGSQTFTTNNIADSGSLTLGTGSNGNLTLTPNGSGDTIINSDFDSGVSIGSSSNTLAVLSISGGIGSNGALIVNQTNSGDIFDASVSGTTKFSIANSGDVIIGGTTDAGYTLNVNGDALISANANGDDIVKQTTSDFTQSGYSVTTTDGVNNVSTTNNQVSLATDLIGAGGTLTAPSAGTAVGVNVVAGGVTFQRPDKKFVVIPGGSTSMQIYDPTLNTYSTGPTMQNTVTTGSQVFQRADGKFIIVAGGGTGNTVLYDPAASNNVGVSRSGPPLAGPINNGLPAQSVAGAGSQVIRRSDGKVLLILGNSSNGTNLYDPTATTSASPNADLGSFLTGPTLTGNVTTGSFVLERPNGTWLIGLGGTNTTNVYDPTVTTLNGNAGGGSFTSGPSWSGVTATTTGAGAHVIQMPDGRYLIILGGGSATTVIYDPVNNIYAAGPSLAGGDTVSAGGHSFQRSDGKWILVVGGTSKDLQLYDPSANTFTQLTGANGLQGATGAGAGAHTFQRPDGMYVIVHGNTTGLTTLYDAGWNTTGTWTSEDINSTKISTYSAMIWSANPQSANNNARLDGDTLQIYVKTADVENALTNAPWVPLQDSGDLIRAYNTTRWMKIQIAFNTPVRSYPGQITDSISQTNIWNGEGGTFPRRTFIQPTLFSLRVQNPLVSYGDPTGTGDPAFGRNFATDSATLEGVYTNNSNWLSLQTIRNFPDASNSAGFIIASASANLGANAGAGAHAIQRSSGQFIIIVGGGSTTTRVYDPDSNLFSTGPTLPAAAGAGAHSFLLPDGRFFVVLGNSSTNTAIFDPQANVFTAGPTLFGAVGSGANSFQLPDGSFMIINGGNTRNTNIVNPFSMEVTQGPFTTSAAGNGGLNLRRSDGRVLVMLGQAQTITNLYDPATNAFLVGPAMTASSLTTGGGAIQLITGKWVVKGATTATQLYDPVQNTFTGAGPTTTANVGAGGAIIPRSDGKALILLGGNTTTTNVLDTQLSTGAMVVGPTLPCSLNTGGFVLQRPTGEYLVICGGSTANTAIIDAGWNLGGTYTSEQINLPSLSTSTSMYWKNLSNAGNIYVKYRTASSQLNLGLTSWQQLPNSGSLLTINNGDTWFQTRIDLEGQLDDQPGSKTRVWLASDSGGAVVYYRQVQSPILQYWKLMTTPDPSLLTLTSNGSNVFRFTSDGQAYTSADGAWNSGGADLAERYSSNDTLQAGEVVSLDTLNPTYTRRTTIPYDDHLVGVVSTDPGFVAGAFTANSYPIALVGRVPVNVSTENGPIHAGDYLTSGSIPGYAMKATVGGRVIGQAMEDFDPTNGLDQLSSTIVCPQYGAGALPATQCGSITVFVNMTSYNGQPIDVAMQDKGVISDSNTGLSAGSIGIATTTPQVNDKELQALSFLQQESQVSSTSASLYTNHVYAVNDVIAPQIITDLLVAKTIKADSIEGIQFIIDNAIASESASLSNNLFSTSSGQITGGSLSIDSFSTRQATVSADLRVQGNSIIEGILNVIDTITTNNIVVNELATFFGDVIFHGNVTIGGHTIVSGDTAGTVVIKAGTNSVDVTFTNPYDITPVVTATLTGSGKNMQDIFSSNTKYIITNRTTKGFTIQLSENTSSDMTFSWIAVQISGQKNSEQTNSSIEDVAGESTSSITPTPLASSSATVNQ